MGGVSERELRRGKTVADGMPPVWKVTGGSSAEVDLAPAVRCLLAGGVIAYPTETYYGLGCLPFSRQALERIYIVKGRPRHKALPLIASDLQAARRCVLRWTARAERLAERFWPGPLTIIAAADPELPEPLCAGSGKVAVRVSSHWAARYLAARIGGLIVSTSANRSGEPPCCRVSSLPRSLALRLDGIVDCGTTPGGKASTLVDVSAEGGGGIEIVRPGAISREALSEALR